MTIQSILLVIALLAVSWLLLGSTFFVGGRLLPIGIGVAVLGLSCGLVFLPLPNCGSIWDPRFSLVPSDQYPLGSLAERCVTSQNMLGLAAVGDAVAGVGVILVGIVRTVGYRRTLTLLGFIALLILTGVVIPTAGVGALMAALAIIAACGVSGVMLTKAAGIYLAATNAASGRRRRLVATIWVIDAVVGLALVYWQIGWRATVLAMVLLIVLAVAAFDLVLERWVFDDLDAGR